MLFPEMKSEIVAAKTTATKARTMYLVAAWHNNDKRWSVRRENSFAEFTSVDAAEKYASKLSGVWSNIQIIKLDFPGEMP